VPLTPSRLGSFSTRTTHPHMIGLFRTLLRDLGIPLEIDLPYRFATKGEMLTGCRNRAATDAGVPITMSCARPAAGRFAGSPNRHCGRCVPCIIRRAAIRSARSTDPTEYIVTNLHANLPGASGSDVRVLRLALERYGRRRP